MKWGHVSLWAMLRPAVSTYSDEMPWLSRRFVLSHNATRLSNVTHADRKMPPLRTFTCQAAFAHLEEFSVTTPKQFTVTLLIFTLPYSLCSFYALSGNAFLLFYYLKKKSTSKQVSWQRIRFDMSSWPPFFVVCLFPGKNTWPSYLCGLFSFILCSFVKL